MSLFFCSVVESSQIKDATPDSTGKEQSKGGPMNNKSRKLHGCVVVYLLFLIMLSSMVVTLVFMKI